MLSVRLQSGNRLSCRSTAPLATIRRVPAQRNNAYLFLACMMFLAAGLFGFQRYYINKHLPLIKAELAEALEVGDGVLESIGVPPGAHLMEPIQKTVHKGGTRGKWQGTQIGVTWVAFYDAPGTHAEFDDWYRRHLQEQGWTVRQPSVPSTVQVEFYKDIWLLTEEHEAWFKERQPHARFRLRLEWDYRHDLGP
jgi:hypothetical protein